MTSPNPAANDIFLKALEIPDSTERLAYVDQACGGDAELRRAVEELLRARAETGAVPQTTAPTVVYEPSEAIIGTRFGPYKVLQKIGEGGMGTVYMAEQDEPVMRRVALKIIKAGMDSAHVLARFEQERQALALMDHPNIARVLDAGTVGQDSNPAALSDRIGILSHTCRPYFVMELVRGLPITKYCDREHLSPNERLELFIPVCQAVQHAHQKGIIHRDLKPSNVIVALYDGKPIPKVIDFGVAKATQQKLTERTMFTELGQIVGTLEYMAPEQAVPDNLDIDTRVDIYSLGVLLYELLTGSPPFSRKQLRSAAFDEMLRMIKEVDPPKPSTKLSSSAELPSIAANRKLEPKKLTRLVHGDLDWIAMKCLAKERARRYETANGLAMDLQRYLADEPVLARPPGLGYRLGKFVRRNKVPVAAGAAVLLALVAGLTATTLLYWEASAARIAEAEQRKQAEEARDEAKRVAAQAEAVANFLVKDMLSEADPRKNPRDKQITVEEALNRAVSKIDKALAGQPDLEASVRATVGSAYHRLGLYAEAELQLRRALEQSQRFFGAEHASTLAAMNNLALVLRDRGKLAEAEALYRQVLEAYRRKLGEEHAHTLIAMTNLGGALLGRRKLPEAEQVFRQVLEIRQGTLGADHADTILAGHNLAVVLVAQSKLEKAEPLVRQTLEARRRQLGEEHPHTLSTLRSLGTLWFEQGKFAEAEALFRRALDAHRRVEGAEHPHTLGAMNNVAATLHSQGKYAESEELARQVLQMCRRVLGEEHSETLAAMNNLASSLQDQGNGAAAEPLFREALQLQRRTLPAGHPDIAHNLVGLAEVLAAKGEAREAEQFVTEALEIVRKALPKGYWRVALAQSLLGACVSAQGRHDQAEPHLLSAYETIKSNASVPARDKRKALERIVQLYDAWNKPEEAAKWRKKLEAAKAAPKP